MLTFISELVYKISNSLFTSRFSQEGFVTYLRNVGWITISKFFTLPLSLITTSVVARTLGPETFGTLSYVLSINVLFAVLANLGIENIVYKELISHKHKREEILGSAMALKFTTGCIALIISTTTLAFTQENLYIKTLVFLVSLTFLTQPLTLLGFDFLKDKEAKYTTIAQVITSFISNMLKIITVTFFSSIAYFILTLVVENIVLGIVYFYQIRFIKRRSTTFIISKREIISLLTLAVPLTLFSAFTEIYSRIDQIMLKHYIDEKAVGLYAAATRLTEIWYIIPTILLSALFPALTEVVDNGMEYKKRIKTLSFILFSASILIATITCIFSRSIITIVYGEDFITASPLLVVYIFSLLGSFISMLINQDLLLRKKVWIIILLPILTALINILINIKLIPEKGALGAALATVISYNIVPLVYYLIQNSQVQRPYHTVRSLLRKNNEVAVYPITP